MSRVCFGYGIIMQFMFLSYDLSETNRIEGSVHCVFRSTSTWENFDKSMKIDCKQWLNNQNPENCSSCVAS